MLWNKIIKYSSSIILFFTWMGTVSGQQDGLISQHIFNSIYINPAYTGSTDGIDLNLFFRKQWSSIEGAPTSGQMSIHSPLWNDKMGLGVNMQFEKMGIINRYVFNGSYAYRVKAGKGHLSFGLQAGMNYYHADWLSLDATQEGDAAFQFDGNSQIVPNFGAGIYYQSRHLSIGVASPAILAEKIAEEGSQVLSKGFFLQNRYYITQLAVVINPDSPFSVKPALLVKIPGNLPVQIDANLHFLIYNTMWFGLGYRSDKTFSVQAQYIVNMNNEDRRNTMMLGYSFDIASSELKGYSGSTHEVFVNFNFGRKVPVASNPRYF